MSQHNLPRVPLFFQSEEVNKAASKYRNPSYESFRPNEIFKPQYSEMEDRATTSPMSRIRRFPSGELDYAYLVMQVQSAVHNAEYNYVMTPLEESLLTVLFPLDFPMTEPQLAEVRTQLSDSEKEKVRALITAKLKEEFNYNAGLGGSSVPGRSRSNSGG